MLNHKRSLLILVSVLAVSCVLLAEAQTPPPKRDTFKKKATIPKESQVTTADLMIDNITEQRPGFFIVRIKNAGKADAGATSLMILPMTGVFSKRVSFPVPPLKAGGVTEVSCPIPQYVPRTNCQFYLNQDKKVTESNYTNNQMTYSFSK